MFLPIGLKRLKLNWAACLFQAEENHWPVSAYSHGKSDLKDVQGLIEI